MSVNRAHLRHLVEKGSKRASSLTKVLENPEWFLGTTLLGLNLATMTLNAIATLYVIDEIGERYSILAAIVTVPLMLVFGEAFPKTLFQRYADRLALYVIYPLRIISWILSPLVLAVAGTARLVNLLFGVKSKKRTPFITREELELAFQSSAKMRGVKDLERKMISRIFMFSDRQARDIMLPLAQVVSISQDATIADAAAEMRRSGYSRFPVFGNGVFNIVGWINHYDVLFAKEKSAAIRSIIRPIRFIPAGVELGKLLVTMQLSGDSLSIVVDEYGGAIGLITLEDIIEEVVGDIEDEYDSEAPLFRRIDPHYCIVKGRIPIIQLSELLQTHIPRGDYETVGGFLMSKMQHIPKKGEEFRYRKLLFRVREATDRSVEEIEIMHP